MKRMSIVSKSDYYIEFLGWNRDGRTDSNWSEFVCEDLLLSCKFKSQFISDQLLWRIVNAKTLFPKSL